MIVIFLQGRMMLSSKLTICIYFKIDKILALQVVSHRVPLATRPWKKHLTNWSHADKRTIRHTSSLNDYDTQYNFCYKVSFMCVSLLSGEHVKSLEMFLHKHPIWEDERKRQLICWNPLIKDDYGNMLGGKTILNWATVDEAFAANVGTWLNFNQSSRDVKEQVLKSIRGGILMF